MGALLVKRGADTIIVPALVLHKLLAENSRIAVAKEHWSLASQGDDKSTRD